jgi:large subunit ribosomal protein L18
VTFSVETPTRFAVHGIDKQQVGEVAANLRKLRKPEPVQGQGHRYAGEQIAARSERRASEMSVALKTGKHTAARTASRLRRQRRGASGSRHRRAAALVVTRSSRTSPPRWSDDVEGRTLAAASTMEADLRADRRRQERSRQARRRGRCRASAGRGVATVVFDRAGHRYHGRVAALADGARNAGLRF